MNQISYISKLALILKHIKSDFSPSTVHKCYVHAKHLRRHEQPFMSMWEGRTIFFIRIKFLKR